MVEELEKTGGLVIVEENSYSDQGRYYIAKMASIHSSSDLLPKPVSDCEEVNPAVSERSGTPSSGCSFQVNVAC